ncbi:MAG: hypothetical protein ACYCW6_24430 [Candidatus Xenobia bacterium]
MISSVATPTPFRAAVRSGGAVGAAAGAEVGPVVTSLAVSGGVGLAAHLALTSVPLPYACLGPIGVGLAATVGLVGGAWLEHRLHAGQVAGAMLGGSAGMLAGAALGTLGVRPSSRTAAVTDSFSLSKLPQRVLDPQPTMPAEAVQALMAAQPGDVLLVPSHFQIVDTVEKLAGGTGDFGHSALVGEAGYVLDLNDKGAHERPKRAWQDYSQLAVLRPHYRSQEEALAVARRARQAVKTVTYDDHLTMPKPGEKSDGKEYCTEFVYDRLQEAAPEIRLIPTRALGQRFVLADTFLNSPDMDVVYNSGSNYWLNRLGRFC